MTLPGASNRHISTAAGVGGACQRKRNAGGAAFSVPPNGGSSTWQQQLQSLDLSAPYRSAATLSKSGTKQPAPWTGQRAGSLGRHGPKADRRRTQPTSIPALCAGARAPPPEPVLAPAQRGANRGDSSTSQAARTSEPARRAPAPQPPAWAHRAPPLLEHLPPPPPLAGPLPSRPERQHRQGQPHQRQAAAQAHALASKYGAAARVKDLLKPLYAKGDGDAGPVQGGRGDARPV